MRVTLKSVNEELARLGHNVELVKGGGYFFFRGGEADDWIDRAVQVATISSLTLEQWIGEYDRLKTVNQQFTKATPTTAESSQETERATAGAGATTAPKGCGARCNQEGTV